MKRFENIVFLIAGVISFSLFFLLGFAIFLLIKVFLNKEQKKYRLTVIVAVTAIFVAVFTVPVLNEMVGSRLEFNEDTGTIAGNNRSGEDLDDYIASIRGTSKYFWGDPKSEEDFSGHASLQNGVLRYGVVFMVLFFVFYYFYAKTRLHKNWREIWMFNHENHVEMWTWLAENLPVSIKEDPQTVLVSYQKMWIDNNDANNTVVNHNYACDHGYSKGGTAQMCRFCPLLYKCTMLVDDLLEAMKKGDMEEVYDVCMLIANSPVIGRVL